MTRGHVLLAIALFVVTFVFLFVDPYPQPQAYHEFADDRTMLGVANFWNVATNAVFLAPGITGLWILRSGNHPGILPGMFPAYHILFTGILLTAFGSAWFHLAPNNDSLFWDRLPMTVGFMSLFAILIGEHVSGNLGQRLLWPLLFIGAVSIFYWDYSESRNAGDLRLYGLVQFLPLLLIPAILLLYRSVFDRIGFIWLIILLYVVAKVFEQLDGTVYNFGELISGHSIKHVIAALGPLVLIYGMDKRRVRQAETQ